MSTTSTPRQDRPLLAMVPAACPDTRFENKLRVWDHIKTLPVKSSYLGPAGFLETLFWPTFPEGTQTWQPDYVHKYIATEDIGHVAADFLADPERYAGRELMLAGDAVTAADVKRAWEEVVGIELKALEAADPFVQEMVSVCQFQVAVNEVS